MYTFLLPALSLFALAANAAPSPQSTNIQTQVNTPTESPIDLGANISFTPFYTDPTGAIVIPVGGSIYNLSFTDSSATSDTPPPQNYPAALTFIQRYFKDDFFNSDNPNLQSEIALPVIDVKTAGVQLHLETTGPRLKYNLFFDVLAHISYFQLSFQRQASLFELIDRSSGAVAYRGWIGDAAQTRDQQFGG